MCWWLTTGDGLALGLPKLQAKVHVKDGDLMQVASLLVERNICAWVEWDSVLEYRGQKVFNGLFGVAKSAKLSDGRPHLSVIMNLIPSNPVLHQLTGCVKELPSITQYMSLLLEEGETLSLCQSDMTLHSTFSGCPKSGLGI